MGSPRSSWPRRHASDAKAGAPEAVDDVAMASDFLR
jgi:hypothetical protein